MIKCHVNKLVFQGVTIIMDVPTILERVTTSKIEIMVLSKKLRHMILNITWSLLHEKF